MRDRLAAGRFLHVVLVLFFAAVTTGAQAQDTDSLYQNNESFEDIDTTMTIEEMNTDSEVEVVTPYPDTVFDTVPANPEAAGIRRFDAGKVKSLQESDDYWYANREPKKEKEQRQEVREGTSIPDYVWYIIIGLFAAALIWYLASINVRLFRPRSAVIPDDEETDAAPEDIFAADYDRQIAKASEAGNYRLAIRLLFLRTLRDLSNAGLIEYRQESTNSNYLLQLSGSDYHRDFFRLTREFEYTWYGKFAVDGDVYSQIEQDFTAFKRRVPA